MDSRDTTDFLFPDLSYEESEILSKKSLISQEKAHQDRIDRLVQKQRLSMAERPKFNIGDSSSRKL
jgi:hypothetical protein